MRIIGITGGIGTGKSTVLHLLQDRYGACIVEADRLAHELMQPETALYEQITGVFGAGIRLEDGPIDRNRLGAVVFRDAEKLATLNAIVHPAVKEYIKKDIREKEQQQVELYIIEAALLIEDGYRSICDELWYVYTEREERIRRILQSRGGTREKWEQVMDNQSSDTFYKEHCDVIIDNGKDVTETSKRINDLLFSNG
ncbi:MAG: dephospho-CoA kinase [Lachnospiraceae bacterium]|nr:dephospho-CoA kinase [Lachnospiraceae bacterium]